MNLFCVFGKKAGKDEQGQEVVDVEVATPDLDGTILPGVTVSQTYGVSSWARKKEKN